MDRETQDAYLSWLTGKAIPRRPYDDGELSILTYRERQIIKLRNGIGYETAYTLEETARIFKVTRERVRLIERKAMDKLTAARESLPAT